MIKKSVVWTDITLPADEAIRRAEGAVRVLRNGYRAKGFVTYVERYVKNNGNICYEITAVKRSKMSKQFIDKEAALELSEHIDRENGNKHFNWGVESYAEFLRQLPPADVKPVVRGEWIGFAEFEQCSVCKATHLKEIQTVYGKAIWVKSNFCPNCGADMREEENDER